MGPASSKKNKTQNTFESFGSIIGEVNCQRLGTIAFTMTNTTVELLCDLKALGCQRIHAELLYLKNIGIKDDESVSLLKHQVTNVFRFRACLRKLIIGSFLDDASQFYGPRLPSNASSVALRTTFASDDEITEAGLCFSKQHQFRTSSCESAKNVILLGSNFFRMGQEAEILFLPHWLIMQGKRDWTRNFMDDPESEPFSDCKAWSSEGRAIPQLEMHVVFDKARKRLGE
ncbi:MAG: hypothetical protein M1812_000157 [Candelaria pacifica]|nr:MAG: hypothetical protein M1812_000157 [Candelaria pacifica]